MGRPFVRQVEYSGLVRGQSITCQRDRDTLLIVFQPNLYSIVQPTTLSLASFLLPIMYSITQHCPIEVNARLQCSNFSRVIASLIAYNLVCFPTSSAHCGITCIGSLQYCAIEFSSLNASFGKNTNEWTIILRCRARWARPFITEHLGVANDDH